MNITLKTISIKGKEYVTVNERIRAFTEACTNGKITTKLLSALTDKHVFVEATVTPDVSNPERYFTAHSQGVDGEGMVNKTACLENVETSAIGRALGLMGIGILESVASADEMVKAGVAPSAPKTPTSTDDKCMKCGSHKVISKNTGKPYCAAKCWLNKPEQDEIFPTIEEQAF